MKLLRLIKIATILAVIIFISSCSGNFLVKPDGNLNDGVKFNLYEASNGDRNVVELTIVEVGVQELLQDGKWSTIWLLDGHESQGMKLKKINYGKFYDGLKEKVVSHSFKKNTRYKVNVTATPSFAPYAYASAVFYFDGDGSLVIVEFNGVKL